MLILFELAGDTQDAHVDRGRVHVQELLHHHGNVSAYALLRIHWSHTLWLCETRRGTGQVSWGCIKDVLFLKVFLTYCMSWRC